MELKEKEKNNKNNKKIKNKRNKTELKQNIVVVLIMLGRLWDFCALTDVLSLKIFIFKHMHIYIY